MTCAVSRVTLQSALIDALGIEPEQAAEVVEFLTFAERPKVIRGKRARRDTGDGEPGRRGLCIPGVVSQPVRRCSRVQRQPA